MLKFGDQTILTFPIFLPKLRNEKTVWSKAENP